MNMTLDKIKKILVVTILAAVVVNLIINHVKQYKSSSENNIQKLIADISFSDKTQYRIYEELTDIESNKISEDAANAIYLRYGMGYLTEEEFIGELKKGLARAEKVYKSSLEKCEQCSDYVRIGMKSAKEYGAKVWEYRVKDAEKKIAKAKEGGKIKELGLKNEYLKEGVKWFTEKHSCLDIKQESGNLSEILKNK